MLATAASMMSVLSHSVAEATQNSNSRSGPVTGFVGSNRWSKPPAISAVLGQQRLQRGASLRRQREMPAASPTISPLTIIAVTAAPVIPARSHSVPQATQKSKMRSGIESSAWMAVACSSRPVKHVAPCWRRPVGSFFGLPWLRSLPRSRRPHDDSAKVLSRHVSAVRRQLQRLAGWHWVGFVGHGEQPSIGGRIELTETHDL
jgi:hypothetical protein